MNFFGTSNPLKVGDVKMRVQCVYYQHLRIEYYFIVNSSIIISTACPGIMSNKNLQLGYLGIFITELTDRQPIAKQSRF